MSSDKKSPASRYVTCTKCGKSLYRTDYLTHIQLSVDCIHELAAAENDERRAQP